MADMLDNVMTGQPSPDQGGPGASDQGGDAGAEAKPKSRYDQRIDQLVAEREALKRQSFEEQGRLKAEIEELRSRVDGVSSPKPDADRPINSWSDFTDSQLEKVMRENSDNPDVFAQALREFSRRSAESAASRAASDFESKQTRQQYRQQVFAQIVQDFGQDAANQSSELYRRADSEYAKLQQQYRQVYGQKEGDQKLSDNPEAQYACFARAASQLAVPEKEELARLRQEAEKRKQLEMMEGGVGNAIRIGEETRSALDKGDWRGAIKKLPIIPRR